MAAKKKAAAPAKAAKPKAKGKSTLLDSLSGLTPPSDAWGLGRAKGLGANPTVEAFLGCGFPNMVIATDEPPPDELPGLEAFLKAYEAAKIIPRWAVEKLYAVSRAGPDPVKQAAALAGTRTYELDQPAIVDLLAYRSARQLYLLEALFGSEAACELLVAHLASFPPSGWKGTFDRCGYTVVRGLGGALRRVPAGVREKHRGTLKAVFDKVWADDPKLWRSGKALDVIVNGRAGVERSGNGFNGELFLSEYVWAEDDPAWVRERVLARLKKIKPADREWFDPQLAVIGGAPLVAAFKTSADRFLVGYRKDLADYATLFA